MSSCQNHKRTLEERLIIAGIAYSYLIYFFGGLYLTGSLLGYTVLGLILLRAFVEGRNPFQGLSPMVLVWGLGMLFMLIALIVAHSQWHLGMGQTIKSAVGWMKGWALFALFVYLGTQVKVNTDILVRTVCKLGFYSLIFALISIVLYLAGSNGQLYVSPLKLIGGAGDNFFTVSFFGYNPETGAGRWQFFAPWAPAAGLIACTFSLFCVLEKDIKWKILGLLGFAVMIVLSQSRAGLVMFIFIIPLFYFTRLTLNPYVLIAAGLMMPFILFIGEPVVESVMETHQAIKDARPASTRVRGTLENIALQRWQAEAPVWGHGVVERGPKLVEFMPIGSHHTWLGLLFVKGWVGCIALIVPLSLSLVILLATHYRSANIRSALCMLIILCGYSFFENIEILAYLIWPIFFWFGKVFQSLTRVSNSKELL